MKKIIFPLVIMATLLVVGCSEKFKVAAPYKNITVIYAFLDRTDTAHYIRVQKAFLDQDKSALVMSKEPDSSFYKNLNVRINRLKITDSSHVFDTIHLNRVDLDNEGYPKEPGVFFTAPNFAYKFKNDLDPNFIYRIIVTNGTTGEVDSADAGIIDDVTQVPRTFFVDLIDDSGTNHGGLDFAQIASFQQVEMNIEYHPPVGASPVYLAYPIIRFNWVDSNISNGTKTSHSYDFLLGDNIMATNAIDVKTKNATFYSAISSGLGVAPALTVRLMDRCDIFVYLTTFEYFQYQQSGLTQGVGLTGNEIEPIYTNIKGANALGLYTSRGMHSGKITITPGTIRALIDSPEVASMHIVGTVY